MNNLSSSGARIRGDSYQHMVGWIQVLRAILPNSGVLEIGIEDPDGGNADDVTVYKADGRHDFFQIKSAVDGQKTACVAWLMEPSKTGGPSIVQGLFNVWKRYKSSGSEVRITFYTNRPAAADDNFIALRDGISGTVSKRLKQASSGAAKSLKKKLVTHLSTTEEELFAFLDHLSFKIGRLHDELWEEAKLLMYVGGFRFDDEAITLGESIVRGWVTGGKRRLTMDDIQNEIKHLLRPGELPAASLLIQAIDRDLIWEAATVALDWVDLFDGDEPRTRRVIQDSNHWNTKFRKEIQDAAKSMRSRGETRVLVRGYMRLPTWFTVGVELGRTAGFDEVVSFQGNLPWSSKGDVEKYPVEMICDEKLSDKNEMAISVALSVDPTRDVKHYLESFSNDIGKYICIAPAIGTGNTIIKNEKEARQWAYNVRDMIRNIVREYHPSKIHLFLAVPHGAALLLGHLWDRMPPTQLYEDLGALSEYFPSFLIPN